MPIKRSLLIDSSTAGYYHLMSRCVRRTFLCGIDPDTGKDYNHRKQWIEKRIIELADVFAIEVYAYAVMDNHYHLVVYCDPKAPNTWSDEEVATRWLRAYHPPSDDPKIQLKHQARIQATIQDPERLATYRERLGNLSWLMSRINEPLAKLSNREDCCKGHFWESRFQSQALLDETALLTCMAYVDLNPIRAGKAQTLQESEHTSIQKRINQLTKEQLEQTTQAIAGHIKDNCLTLSLKDYIELVEWTGQAIIHPGKASMPKQVVNTLDRININHQRWLPKMADKGINRYRAIGAFEKLNHYAKQLKLNWLKGYRLITQLYTST